MLQLWRTIRKHLNFYRVHVLAFVFTPLVSSAIFYGLNGPTNVPYVDCLFLCVSAMTVSGLTTLDLSGLTTGQQVLLFLLMCLGSPVLASGVMVFIRRHYFSKRIKHILQSPRRFAGPNDSVNIEDGNTHQPNHPPSSMPGQSALSPVAEDSREDESPIEALRKNILSTQKPPHLNNSSLFLEIPQLHSLPQRHVAFARPSTGGSERRIATLSLHPRRHIRRISDPGSPSRPTWLVNSPQLSFHSMNIAEEHHSRSLGSNDQRKWVENQGIRERPRTAERQWTSGTSGQDVDNTEKPRLARRASAMSRVSHDTTRRSIRSNRSAWPATQRGFGGFPMPIEIAKNTVHRLFPKLHAQLSRSVTVPEVTTIAPQRDRTLRGDRRVSYISFNAVVDKNSEFHMVSQDQLEELAGVEYRALNALLWILACYHIGLQVLGFTIMAPYVSASRWRETFQFPQLHDDIEPVWFALFHAVSSYTNTGMSLVDQSMIPFQRAYGIVFTMSILILAGNTGFPIVLRFTIWVLSKAVPRTSRVSETLQFLLDHPRRCFIYLFPSHQTWVLLTLLIALNFTDWIGFVVLNIGNVVVESMPLAQRFAVGLMQAITIRGGGFGFIPITSLAPAIKVLYVIMMYISVYPLALSVRTTNVYEKQSLGIYAYDDEYADEDASWLQGPRVSVWGRYMTRHIRRQLAFDMWWLALAIFFICIIERSQLENMENTGWFTIFTIIFELVSAYGIIGLSLGLPLGNFSFTGAFHPLSKLLVCLVMIRGRHRGLPVAIDRAVMIPKEFDDSDDEENDDDEGSLSGGRNVTVFSDRLTASPQPQPQVAPAWLRVPAS
ncbi:hypothetical protein HGRIS_008868 [Hohenbuehelia grisea]|uniref:Potassium transport protein n=1 Tax=Hohenbuehelia grisea TaxID=104357 RepID=A0ABR3IZI8_9AGAR